MYPIRREGCGCSLLILPVHAYVYDLRKNWTLKGCHDYQTTEVVNGVEDSVGLFAPKRCRYTTVFSLACVAYYKRVQIGSLMCCQSLIKTSTRSPQRKSWQRIQILIPNTTQVQRKKGKNATNPIFRALYLPIDIAILHNIMTGDQIDGTPNVQLHVTINNR